MTRHGYRIEFAPTLWLAFLSALSGCVMGLLLAWSFREDVAYAEPQFDATALRSQVASCEARLYVADQQACMNVGVHAVAKKGARR